ncbi:unnamed protein product, partial [Linum tenue]
PDDDFIVAFTDKQLQRNQVAAETRRRVLLAGAISTLSIMSPSWMPTPLPARAEGGQPAKDEEEEGVVGAIKSLLDPNEKTKSGKLLPKAYLKSAREVVKTLRESLQEDPKDNAKFRRNADAAKESIREYLGNWRGQEKIAGEVKVPRLFTYSQKIDSAISGKTFH